MVPMGFSIHHSQLELGQTLGFCFNLAFVFVGRLFDPFCHGKKLILCTSALGRNIKCYPP